MTKKIWTYGLLLAICTPAAALAVERPEEPSESERVICQRHNTLGSRAKKERICLSKREWTRLQTETRDAMYEFQRHATMRFGR